jgi:DNA-binding NtrC family response regulator
MSTYGMEPSRALNKLVMVSRAMSEAVKAAIGLANASEAVLVDGEPGVGKRLLACVLHEESRRADRPLVTVHCEALTVAAMNRLLFGDERTGGKGRLEEASDGTLLLLNLEELNPVVQEKLLQVLEEGRYVTTAQETRPLTCRIVCTGDASAIEEQVRVGRFSAELFRRLSVKTLRMPSLAERRDDIPHLVVDILHEFAQRERVEPPVVPYHYMELLMNVSWQENVRQLRNHVESVLALSEGIFDPEIIREHFTPVGSPSTIKGALESLLGRLNGQTAKPATVTTRR